MGVGGMSALPYMPLYVADYLADTAHLSALENGAYLMLIMNYWQRGNPLPAGDAQLARIARLTADEWSAVRPALSDFFSEQDGQWHHGRIEAELAKVRDKSAKASSAGKASAQRKSNERLTPVEQTFNHTDTDTDIEERPLSETSSDESKPDGKRKRVAYPEQFEEFWKSYPTDPNMAKVEAFKAWQKLDADDRGRAIATLPAFKTWVKQQRDYRTLHACRYLSQRRFDGFAGAEQQAGTAALPVKIVLEGTPEWESLKSKNPRLTARDIRTDGGVVRGTYDYGSRAA